MIFIDTGSINELRQIFASEQYERVLFVVDEGAFAASGAARVVEPILKDRVVSRFCGFEPNPKLTDVERGLELTRDLRPDVVVALGGGTAIDLGKLLSVVTTQTAAPRDVVVGDEPIRHKSIPLVVIPTTAGTGSEATHFAVAYVDGKKYSVAHEFLLPDYIIVDPELTYSMPAGITAATGLDALCQSIESMWAVSGTDESFVFAEEACRLALAHLPSAVQQPSPESRMAMCRASHLAGKAINISKTTAPHALSYGLTSRFGIPHGIAVAVTLGPMLVFNSEVTSSDCIDPRGADDVRRRISKIVGLLGAETPVEACAKFQELLASLDCPRTTHDAGITSSAALREIVRDVNTERLSNNPRQASHDALLQMLLTSSQNAVG